MRSRNTGDERDTLRGSPPRARRSMKGSKRSVVAGLPRPVPAGSRAEHPSVRAAPSSACGWSSIHALQAACNWPLKAARVRFAEETTISRYSRRPRPPPSGAARASRAARPCQAPDGEMTDGAPNPSVSVLSSSSASPAPRAPSMTPRRLVVNCFTQLRVSSTRKYCRSLPSLSGSRSSFRSTAGSVRPKGARRRARRW